MIAGAAAPRHAGRAGNAMRFVMVQHRVIGRDGPRRRGELRDCACRSLAIGSWPISRSRHTRLAGSAIAAPTASMPRDKAEAFLTPARSCATETSEECGKRSAIGPTQSRSQFQREDGAKRE